MKPLTFLFSIFITSQIIAQSNLDYFVLNSSENKVVEIANVTDLILTPVDLDFHPNMAERPFELWVLNQGSPSSGGTTVIISDADSPQPTSQHIKDGNAWHFLAMGSAIAFGDNENWATSQDIQDANRNGGKFTGPTLWSSDLSIYGKVGNPPNADYNGSHLDMLHQSPFGKGIAYEKDNVYWVMDGYDGTLKRYNFNTDHGPGQDYHGDGEIYVYNDFSFSMTSSALPQHIVIDDNRQWLYGCDTKNSKIFRMDITSASYNKDLPKNTNEPLAAYQEYLGATVETVLDKNLQDPVGIDFFENRLIITDNGLKELIIYDLDNMEELGRYNFPTISNIGLKGVKVGPDGNIYLVDATNKKVYRMENSNKPAVGLNEKNDQNIKAVFPNPATENVYIESFSSGIKYSVFDQMGREVFNGILNKGKNQINVKGISPGVYHLVSGNENQTISIY